MKKQNGIITLKANAKVKMKGEKMEEILKELVEVLKVSNQRTLWDYLIAIAPIIISVTALVVSIKTTQKQNKIALFEKRFEAVYKLSFIWTIAEDVIEYKNGDPSLLLENGMTNYYLTKKDNESNFFAFYTGVILELAGIECLFNRVNTEDVMKFLDEFQTYVLKVYKEEVCENDREALKEVFLKVEDSKVIDKMEKYLKL